jgi:hypothetical protein
LAESGWLESLCKYARRKRTYRFFCLLPTFVGSNYLYQLFYYREAATNSGASSRPYHARADVFQEHSSRTTKSIQMNENYRQEIPRDDSELNSAPVSFAAVIRQVAIEAMRPLVLMPAPIAKASRGDPPKEIKEEPTTRNQLGPAQKIPLQMQESAESIADSSAQGKQPRKSSLGKLLFAPVPDSLADALGEATDPETLPLDKPGLKGPLEDELARAPSENQLRRISHSVTPSLGSKLAIGKLSESPGSIYCKMGLEGALRFEGRKMGTAFCHSDYNEHRGRLLVAALNLSHPAVYRALKKGDVEAIQNVIGLSIAKYLRRSSRTSLRSAITDALRIQCLALVGKTADSSMEVAQFGQALAKSCLLAGVHELPIFGPNLTSAIHRSFRLGEIQLEVPREALSGPWTRRPEGHR